MRKIIAIVSLALLSPLAALADMAGGEQSYGMMSWGNMMSWGGMMGGGSFWFFIAGLTGLVWLIVGVLLIIWLGRAINKK
ncbi:MAG: hypothetical protein HYT21_02700 [Candidatus Nealsonbacteria bacterium]|nr:hypothetical protein [Candidatus Nealsonbacteria bacterium]